METSRKRVLFVSEAITLAQMVRLVTLARALPREHYEIRFASSHFPEFVFGGRIPVYFTLGSSGNTRCLPSLLEALATPPVDVLLATAGRDRPMALPANVQAMAFVDGHAACAQTRLVIHNGGSSTGYQALAAGTPVLGIRDKARLASARVAVIFPARVADVRCNTKHMKTHGCWTRCTDERNQTALASHCRSRRES